MNGVNAMDKFNNNTDANRAEVRKLKKEAHIKLINKALTEYKLIDMRCSNVELLHQKMMNIKSKQANLLRCHGKRQNEFAKELDTIYITFKFYDERIRELEEIVKCLKK